MPMYDFICNKCGYKFEAYRSYTETTRIKCPKCNGISTTIVYTPIPIIYKADGFYSKDNHFHKEKED